jgi:hypothetical protein
VLQPSGAQQSTLADTRNSKIVQNLPGANSSSTRVVSGAQQQQQQEGAEVGTLRAALAAAQAQLAESQAVVAALQGDSSDASTLLEAGRKQEQALQEVGLCAAVLWGVGWEMLWDV